MSVPTLPVFGPIIFPVPPMGNIIPFTYRDGWTFLQMIEELRTYIYDVLVPGVDENFTKVIEAFADALEQITEDNNETIAEFGALFDAYQVTIQAIIDSINAGNGMDILVGVFGATGDGVTDDTAAIQAAFNAAPNGAVVRFGNGTYRVTDTISNTDALGNRKSVSVDAFGATILIDHNLPVIQFKGGYEQAFAVTNIVPVVDNDVSVSGTLRHGNTLTLTLDVPDEWQRGDVLRLVADNIIPGSRDAGDAGILTQGRVGQFVTHVSDTGNFCVVAGKLDDPYTTRIRIARMRNDVRCEWRGGRFIYTDTAFNPDPANYVFVFEELVGSRILDVTIERTTRGAFFIRECYYWTIRGCKVNFGVNDLTQFAYGYGILNIGSALGTVSECFIAQVRHGYTNGHSMITEAALSNAPVEMHGRPYSNRILACMVNDATGDAYDSHTSGIREQFIGCEAINSFRGIGLRGMNHVVNGFTATDCGGGVAIFDEGTGGTSEGHHITNLNVHNATNVLTVDVGIREGLYQFQRHTNPITVQNVHARNITGRPAHFYFSTVHLSDWNVELTGSGNVAFLSEGSYCFADNIRVDYSAATGAANQSFWFQGVGDAAFPQLLEANNIHLTNNGTVVTAPVVSSGPTYNVARAQIFATNSLVTRTQIPTSAGSSVEWFLKGLAVKGFRGRHNPAGAVAVDTTNASPVTVCTLSVTAEPGAYYRITGWVQPNRVGTATTPMRAVVQINGAGVDAPPLFFEQNTLPRAAQSFVEIWSSAATSGTITFTLIAYLDTAQVGVWSVNDAYLTVERI